MISNNNSIYRYLILLEYFFIEKRITNFYAEKIEIEIKFIFRIIEIEFRVIFFQPERTDFFLSSMSNKLGEKKN
jgi:hypothetical protein